MPADFTPVFATLKPVLEKYARRLAVKVDTPTEYTLVTSSPSPFPQHNGQPMYFGTVRLGKAYVSFHLMPLHMHPGLQKAVTPALKKRMQGKTCFNFKTDPELSVLADLERLTAAASQDWAARGWL